ncbi:reverse transcriptase [Caerostris extrusa]|uniref:Reverse transcriptase n=1 Tax=Caerostris extrusa TaxID=172846 RepID=A0AAV4SYV6_CAEEX|nr:reverse transcriptase [Caerostris extrusa]
MKELISNVFLSANIFDEIHRKVDIEKDIHLQYNKINEKAERLFKVDEEIKDLIDLTDEEYDTVESYRDRKDLLIEVYIRDLLALVNSKTNIKLNDLYDKLGSYLRALETLGDVNPADLPSRSCNWFELLQSKWWEGPKWLYEPPEFWPYTEVTLPEEAMKERRKSVVVNLNIDTKEHFGNRLLYFSSYPRIIHMIAWILRFCQNIRVNSHKLTKELPYEEIQSAEEALIRII